MFHALAFGARVVRAVALQEIDNAPHAQASAESHNKGLQSINSGRKELHIASISPGFSPAMKKAAHLGGRLRPLDTLSRSDLYIGIRIVHVVVIEDVLVLAYGPRFGCVYLVHLTSLGKPRPPAAVDELIQVRRFSFYRPQPCTCSLGAVSNRIWTKRTGAGPATAKCTCRPAW